MKIFLIIPTLASGGAERVMSELANEFFRQNHEVHLVLLAKSEDFYSIYPSIRVHRLNFINKGKLKKILLEINTFLKLYKILKAEKPHAVLSFMEKYNLITIVASRFLRLKVFISDRSNPQKKIPLTIRVLKKVMYRFATGIVAQTSLAKNILVKTTGNKNITIIANPLKPIKFHPEISREKIILNIGRLVPEKGQKYLLYAFSNIQYTDWKLFILGDGPLRSELINLAEKLKIANNLYMPGEVKKIDEWLAKASIFAFPSVSEGFPNALAEAMAAGLPCVSFDCNAGPRDIIKNSKNGFLVSLYNSREFAQKLRILIDNPKLRLSIGVQAKYIQNHLEISKIAGEYISFFREKQN